MFLSSIWHGLATLFHWQVWVALIGYSVVNLLWLLGVGIFMGSGSGKREFFGCAIHTILGTLLQGVLLTGMIFFLMPVMLGASQAMPMSALAQFAWPLVKTGAIAVVVVLVLSFLPIVGSLVTNVVGLDGFLEGLIVFRLFSAIFLEQMVRDAGLGEIVYPGFFQSVGYFLIAIVVAYGGLLVATMAAQAMLADRFEPGATGVLLGPIFARLLSLLPLFMYAQFVGLSIRQSATGHAF